MSASGLRKFIVKIEETESLGGNAGKGGRAIDVMSVEDVTMAKLDFGNFEEIYLAVPLPVPSLRMNHFYKLFSYRQFNMNVGTA